MREAATGRAPRGGVFPLPLCWSLLPYPPSRFPTMADCINHEQHNTTSFPKFKSLLSHLPTYPGPNLHSSSMAAGVGTSTLVQSYIHTHTYWRSSYHIKIIPTLLSWLHILGVSIYLAFPGISFRSIREVVLEIIIFPRSCQLRPSSPSALCVGLEELLVHFLQFLPHYSLLKDE